MYLEKNKYKAKEDETMMSTNYMVDAKELSEEIHCSLNHAYKLIRDCNAELKDKGFLVISGKVPRAYLETRFFGFGKGA